jgi:SAM-dependent methyltransferase
MIHKIKIKLATYSRKPLAWVFRFHNWYILPLSLKRYAQGIILFLNRAKNRESYLEIGCGLGDIIRNVNFRKRLGMDRENNVLRAARFLSIISFQQNIVYKEFTFPGNSISGEFDAIVLVNWIHEIVPEILKLKVTEYYLNNLKNGGVIIIDTVRHEGYTYSHKISFLTENIVCEIIHIGIYENDREVWAIKKV